MHPQFFPSLLSLPCHHPFLYFLPLSNPHLNITFTSHVTNSFFIHNHPGTRLCDSASVAVFQFLFKLPGPSQLPDNHFLSSYLFLQHLTRAAPTHSHDQPQKTLMQTFHSLMLSSSPNFQSIAGAPTPGSVGGSLVSTIKKEVPRIGPIINREAVSDNSIRPTVSSHPQLSFPGQDYDRQSLVSPPTVLAQVNPTHEEG